MEEQLRAKVRKVNCPSGANQPLRAGLEGPSSTLLGHSASHAERLLLPPELSLAMLTLRLTLVLGYRCQAAVPPPVCVDRGEGSA